MIHRLPPALAGHRWGPPSNFLGLEPETSELASAAAVVLPVPYEATTSWGGGTGKGPAALLEASRYVELYDQELDAEPYAAGVATLPPLDLTRAGPAEAHRELRELYGELLREVDGRFVVTVGGEHSISAALALAWLDRLDGDLSILQVDAHADLRDSYGGTPWNHACVMRRILERTDRIASVGVRALTAAERDVIRRHDLTVVFAEELRRGGWVEKTVDALSENVYLTFDVDFFDPSVLPATGTPEPGGGDWWDALDLLRSLFRRRNVVGADVVELAPREGAEASAFLAAKLVYKMIGYRTLPEAIGGPRGSDEPVGDVESERRG